MSNNCQFKLPVLHNNNPNYIVIWLWLTFTLLMNNIQGDLSFGYCNQKSLLSKLHYSISLISNNLLEEFSATVKGLQTGKAQVVKSEGISLTFKINILKYID